MIKGAPVLALALACGWPLTASAAEPLGPSDPRDNRRPGDARRRPPDRRRGPGPGADRGRTGQPQPRRGAAAGGRQGGLRRHARLGLQPGRARLRHHHAPDRRAGEPRGPAADGRDRAREPRPVPAPPRPQRPDRARGRRDHRGPAGPGRRGRIGGGRGAPALDLGRRDAGDLKLGGAARGGAAGRPGAQPADPLRRRQPDPGAAPDHRGVRRRLDARHVDRDGAVAQRQPGGARPRPDPDLRRRDRRQPAT